MSRRIAAKSDRDRSRAKHLVLFAKGVNMQHPKISAMVLALAFGAAMTAGAQTTIIQTLPPDDSQTIVVSPPSAVVVEPAAPAVIVRVAPAPVPDPAADAKCRMLPASSYWDCVNSHGG